MILIADGGATKTNWCVLKDNGEQLFLDTEGYNPYFVDTEYIRRSVNTGFENRLVNDRIDEIYFYGSGCFPEAAGIVRNALTQVFPEAKVFIDLDLLAAARGLLGTKPGFAAILGTGTNTCLYDGSRITENIDSLGYILGDEGSGTAMGKKLLADYIRGYLPREVDRLFVEQYLLTKEQIFQKIYSDPLPNRFCAGISKFIGEHIGLTYMDDLVTTCFREFFTNLVSRYPRYNDYSFNCIGSIAFAFSGQLTKVAAEFNMQTGTITRSPIKGLIDYHIHFKP